MREDLAKDSKRLDQLIELARRLGVTDAAIISAESISIEDDLANLCRDSRCENYGMSASCPPHVAGPSGFRELLKHFKQALVFKIDAPTDILFSDERSELFKLLHEIAASIEQSAVEAGFPNSKGYAGGSCKMIFCRNQPDCRVVEEQGECRNPRSARPSMSGFGINVSKLMEAAGWKLSVAEREGDKDKAKIGTLCGLVLVG